MAKAIALSRAQLAALSDPFEVARMAVVIGSAMALILAGTALPF